MKRWYAFGSVLLFLACALWGVLFWRSIPEKTAETKVQAKLEERADQPQKPVTSDVSELLPYESPIDFQSLWEMNPDIYAWIQIPGTEVSYPILQREGDDSYYLRRNSAGKKDQRGCIFTESEFNSKDFSDPVTLVYGHYMKNGTMFGSLQTSYSTPEGMEGAREIVLYLPDREFHYEVFAGVPYSNRHILYYHNFSDPQVYCAFLGELLSVRSMNANVDKTVTVDPGDRLLILSTCLRGDNQQRYLVLAKKTEDSVS